MTLRAAYIIARVLLPYLWRGVVDDEARATWRTRARVAWKFYQQRRRVMGVLMNEDQERLATAIAQARLTRPDVDVANQTHYTAGAIEPIDYIRAQGWFPDFAAGNVVKYVSRYKLKDGAKDLRKARQYLDWLIEHVEGKA